MTMIFLFLQFLSLFLHKDSCKTILLDLQEKNFEYPIIDSLPSPSNLTFYVSTQDNGLRIINISSLSGGLEPLKEISHLEVNCSLLALFENQFLMILDQSPSNSALHFYNISGEKEASPLQFHSATFELSLHIDSWKWKKNSKTGRYYVYMLEKLTKMMVFELNEDYNLKFLSEISLKDCIRFILSQEDGYLFYHTKTSLHVINMTDLANIQTFEINTTSLVDYYIYYVSFTQIALSPDSSKLYLVYCNRAWGATQFFSWSVSNMTEISYLGKESRGIDCDIGRDELLIILPDSHFALFTDYFGITILEYPSFNFHSKFKFWCSAIHILSDGYFLGVVGSMGKFKSFRFFDFELDQVPYSLVNVVNNMPQFWASHTHYLVAINDQLLLGQFGAYSLLYVITDKVNPYYSYYLGWWLPFHANELQEGLAFSDPNSNYLLIYTHFSDFNSGLVVLVFLKTGDYRGMALIQAYDGLGDGSIQIAQIRDIAYFIPWTWGGYSRIDRICAINVTKTGDIPLEPTNIQIGFANNIAEISSCSKEDKDFVFFTYFSSSYLHICQVDPLNYTQLNEVSRIFVRMRVVDIKPSDSCDLLFIAGDSLIIVDVSNKTNPFYVNNITINRIIEIQLVKKQYLYVMTESATQKLDISQPKNPKYLMNYIFPYKYNALTPYNSAFFIDDIDYSIYHYRAFQDYSSNQHMKSPICLLVEKRSPYYLILLNNPTIAVGIQVSVYYTCIAVGAEFYKITGVVTNVQMASEVNFVEQTSIPSWITFDFNLNLINITADASFLHKNIVIVFMFSGSYCTDINSDYYSGDPKHFIAVNFEQTITFGTTQGSLEIESDKNSIYLKSPSSQSFTMILTLNDAIHSSFIVDSFSGVFITNSKKEGKLTATGFIAPMNMMLKQLRYTIDEENLRENLLEFSINVNDQINDEIKKSFNLTVLKRNSPPILNENRTLHQQFEESFQKNSTICKPSQKFIFSFKKDTFIDTDGDSISYSLQNTIGAYMPYWINFNNIDLIISGIPSLSDEGQYKLKLIASDGFDFNETFFNFTIFDNPPKQTENLLDKNALIGLNFNYTIDSVFVDNDGPENLQYSYEISTENCKISNPNDFWLKFSDKENQFYGTPNMKNKLECSLFDVILLISDGLKTINTSYSISIDKSLSLPFQNESLWPLILKDASETNEVLVNLTSNGSKLMILQADRTEIIFENSSNFNKIQIKGTVKNINFALEKLIVQRNYSILDEKVLVNIFDEFQQDLNTSLPIEKMLFMNNVVHLNKNISRSDKFNVEIGNFYRIAIDKQLFVKESSKMNLNYNFMMKTEGIEADFLQFSSESFEISSPIVIAESHLGTYDASLSAEDEFGNISKYQFLIIVDYNLSEKFIQVLKLIGTFAGPVMSIFAIIKYFYVFYNYFHRKSLEIMGKTIFINKKFKWAFPLIKNDLKTATNILKQLGNLRKTSLFAVFMKNFRTKESPQPISSFVEFSQLLKKSAIYNMLESEKSETIECILEGFILSNFLKKIPLFSRIFMNFKNESERSLITKENMTSQWYNSYFTDVFQEESSKISNYALQIGKYRYSEKNCFIDLQNIENTLQRESTQLKSLKFPKNWTLDNYKLCMIYSLILLKRGIYTKPYFHWFLFEKLAILGIQLLNYRIGDVLLANIDEIKEITCLLRIHEEDKKKAQKFFAVESRNVPIWMAISQKKGVLIMKGTVPSYEKNREYCFTIHDKWKIHMCKFWISVKNDGLQRNKLRVDTQNKNETEMESVKGYFVDIKSTIYDTEQNLKGVDEKEASEKMKYKEEDVPLEKERTEMKDFLTNSNRKY